MSKVFDLFIIGGGINGAGLARDAAGRGLSVCLADKGEIGGAYIFMVYQINSWWS
jgi:glycerol-3-phosphate dehydrogenase